VRLVGELDLATAPHAERAIVQAERAARAAGAGPLWPGVHGLQRVRETTAVLALFEFVD